MASKNSSIYLYLYVGLLVAPYRYLDFLLDLASSKKYPEKGGLLFFVIDKGSLSCLRLA